MILLIKQLGILCLLTTLANTLPTEEVTPVTKQKVSSENELVDGIYNECLKKDSASCVKYKLVAFVDKMLDQRDTIALNEGVTLVKSGEVDKEGAPRTFKAESSIENVVMNKIADFLRFRVIKVDLKGSDIVDAVSSTGRTIDDILTTFSKDNTAEGRGKKKKAKLLGPLILAVALKAAALLPLALGAIALIAGKALLIGKIALVLSAVIGLKKLLSQEKHVTYEVVAHPHHSSSHSASHSEAVGGSGYSSDIGSFGSGGHGWGRSLTSQDIAYQGHI